MKKQILFGIASLALLGSAGAGVVLANPAMHQVNAEITQTSNYYLAGKFGGVEHWNKGTTTRLSLDSEKTDLGFITNVSLAVGDDLKFKLNDEWTTALGIGSLAGGEARGAFNGADNIHCIIAGTYDFYINSSSQIYVFFSGESTYSYVLSSKADFMDTLYVYNDEDTKLLPWEEWVPAGVAAAYNIKYDEEDYTVYRVNDNYLCLYNYFIIHGTKDAVSKQTADIHNQKATEKLWWDGVDATVGSANEYAAWSFVYKLANTRGAAHSVYKNEDYKYSICAMSAETASELYSEYTGFSPSIKTLLNDISINTYDHTAEVDMWTREDIKADYSIPTIMATVAKLADGSPAKFVFNDSIQESPLAITIITIAALFGIGGLCLLRKHKAE